MTVKRLARSGQSRFASQYGLDYGLKHRQLDSQFRSAHRQLLAARDPQLRLKNARAITVASNNCNPYNPEPDFARERRYWGKNQRHNQAGVYVLAANKQNWDELKAYLAKRDYHGNRSRVKEIDLYHEWGKMALQLGEAIAGNGKDFKDRLADGKKYGQVAVQTHADEHGMHAHIEVNAIHMATGKKMNYRHDELMTIYSFADKIYRSRNLTITQAGLERVLDPDTGKYITQRKGGYTVQHQGKQISSMVQQGKYSYVDALNAQFELVFADPAVKSKQAAIKALGRHNVAVDQWDKQHKYIKAHIIKLSVDIKTHGRLTRKKGQSSRSMRVKTLTRQEADHELSLPLRQRKATQQRLSSRLVNYQTAINVDPHKYTLQPHQQVLQRALRTMRPASRQQQYRTLVRLQFAMNMLDPNALGIGVKYSLNALKDIMAASHLEFTSNEPGHKVAVHYYRNEKERKDKSNAVVLPLTHEDINSELLKSYDNRPKAQQLAKQCIAELKVQGIQVQGIKRRTHRKLGARPIRHIALPTVSQLLAQADSQRLSSQLNTESANSNTKSNQALSAAREEAALQDKANEINTADSLDHDRTPAEDKIMDELISQIDNLAVRKIAEGIAARNKQLTFNQVLRLAELTYSNEHQEQRLAQQIKGRPKADKKPKVKKPEKKQDETLTPEEIAYLQQQGMDME